MHALKLQTNVVYADLERCHHKVLQHAQRLAHGDVWSTVPLHDTDMENLLLLGNKRFIFVAVYYM